MFTKEEKTIGSDFRNTLQVLTYQAKQNDIHTSIQLYILSISKRRIIQIKLKLTDLQELFQAFLEWSRFGGPCKLIAHTLFLAHYRHHPAIY